MSKHFLHWHTPDREAGPGRFVAAGERFTCEGGPLDGRAVGVVETTSRLWYAMLPDGRWALATADGNETPSVIEGGELRGRYVPEPDHRTLRWHPAPGAER